MGKNSYGQDLVHEITTPTLNTSYPVGATVQFHADNAVDLDRYLSGSQWVYEPDTPMRAHSWYLPVWSFSGQWQNPDPQNWRWTHGSAPLWTAPWTPTANIPIEVYQQDNRAPEDARYDSPDPNQPPWDDDACRIDMTYVHAVGVEKLQYQVGENPSPSGWIDVLPWEPVVFAPAGMRIHFRAVKAPSGVPWPVGKPAWGGTAGINGTGETQSILFEEPPATFKTVTVECGNIVSIDLVIYAIDIAMDGNRDGAIQFDNPADKRYLFWVNADHDERHWDDDGILFPGYVAEDDLSGPPDHENDFIGHNSHEGGVPNACRRDLEDFTRLHIKVNNALVTYDPANTTYHAAFVTVQSGQPEINLFEAVDPTLKYLEVGGKADAQLTKTRLATVLGLPTYVEIPRVTIKSGDAVSPFLIEGRRAGIGELAVRVAWRGRIVTPRYVAGQLQTRQETRLDLRPIDQFYERYVNSVTMDNWPTYVPEEDRYVLFVHGWRVDRATADRWTETMFKRLWWEGYKGRVGCFQWPTGMEPLQYNDSELTAWQCAGMLRVLLRDQLRPRYGGRIAVLAHSMGNVVMGEALRELNPGVVNVHIAAQAAIPAHCYGALGTTNGSGFTTPNIYGYYYSGLAPDTPYLAGNADKATLYNYYNVDDWALGWWNWNNRRKPIGGSSGQAYGYIEGEDPPNIDFYNPAAGDRFTYYLAPLPLPDERYVIFAHCARARSQPLGAEGNVERWTPRNLQSAPLNYDDGHYSHSRQFRSNIVDEKAFWEAVMDDGFRREPQ